MSDLSETTVRESLFRVQQEIGAIKKSATNPHFKSKYADLNEVLSVCKEVLHKHGLFITQPCNKDEKGFYVETQIHSTAGLVCNSVIYLSGAETNMQHIGAAITYARRYGLSSLLALESEDDDGETAVGRVPAAIPKNANAVAKQGLSPSLLAAAKPFVKQPAWDDGVEQSLAKVISSKPEEKTIFEHIAERSAVAVAQKAATRESLLAYMQKEFNTHDKNSLNGLDATMLLAHVNSLIEAKEKAK